jgi:hypothetical protein
MIARLPSVSMSEGDLQASVVDVARRMGGLVYHTHDSRRSPAGFPDLVITFPRTGSLIFVELKSSTGRLRPEQAQWLEALQRGERLGLREVHLWTPADWPEPIVDTLTRCAREVIR